MREQKFKFLFLELGIEYSIFQLVAVPPCAEKTPQVSICFAAVVEREQWMCPKVGDAGRSRV
jgi:hypothetical protein